jgi:hypothetical protein
MFSRLYGLFLCIQGIQGLHYFHPDISSADHYNKSLVSGCKYKNLPATGEFKDSRSSDMLKEDPGAYRYQTTDYPGGCR